MNMFFDEMSQKIIVDAKKEMYQLKHPYVGSEHLLLSILNHKDLDITKTLNSFGITYELFRNELIESVGIGKKENDLFLFTPLLKDIINHSAYYSDRNQAMITPSCLLISILQEGDGVANRLLIRMNVDIMALYEKFIHFPVSNSSFELLDSLGINMNDKSVSGEYDPVVGREEILSQLIQVLLQKKKNNPLLIGEAGVGKTAIVEEFAHRIVVGNVPNILKNKIIYAISMSQIVSGTKYRGEFEEKIHKIIKEVEEHPNVILFIDEIHTIIGAGGAEGAIDASNILKPFLARGNVQIIGATTVKEYHETIEKDKAFNRRFQKIIVPEAEKKEVLSVLKKISPIYEKYHGVFLPKNILKEIVDLSCSCIFNGKQPDKAIDLLDAVCSYTVIHTPFSLKNMDQEIKKIEEKKNQAIICHNFQKASAYRRKELKLRSSYNDSFFNHFSDEKLLEVKQDFLYEVIYQKSKGYSQTKMKELIARYENKIIGKKNNYRNSIHRIFLDLSKYDYISNKNTYTVLFISKNDTLITFLADKILKNIFNGCNCITIDLVEFQEAGSLYKLIGSSYLYQKEYILQSIEEHPFTILFLKHFDQAHPSIIQFFLDSFSNGFFYNDSYEKIILSKCIVFLTSYPFVSEIGFQKTVSSSFIESKIKNIYYFDAK